MNEKSETLAKLFSENFKKYRKTRVKFSLYKKISIRYIALFQSILSKTGIYAFKLWGGRGRGFKSRHSDHNRISDDTM